jgi:hypothetical protein
MTASGHLEFYEYKKLKKLREASDKALEQSELARQSKLEVNSESMSRFLLREYIWDDLKTKLTEREKAQVRNAAIKVSWQPAGAELDLNLLDDKLRAKVLGLSVEIALIFKTRSINARARRQASYGSPRGAVKNLTDESMFY